MRVNVNGFRLRFQTDREQVAVHVQAHGGYVISTEHIDDTAVLLKLNDDLLPVYSGMAFE